MWRHMIEPRKDWENTVIKQGLIYPMTDMPDGTKRPYWNESAWYEFTMEEVTKLEEVTEELWRMCKHAVRVMADGRFTDEQLGLPIGALELVRESLEREDPDVYARFDLCWSGVEPKMLEINGDTPTGLVESAVVQWYWLESVFPEGDQCNSLHDRLVLRWKQLMKAGAFPGKEVHFFNSKMETSGEEEMTVAYMRDTAAQAELRTFGHVIEDVGWDVTTKRFVDAGGRDIRTAFKLYATEDMLWDEFGAHIMQRDESERVRWVEPIWKVLMSTKAILAVLWELYPDHPNLLPAYLGDPRDLLEWVKKPLHGREGDNIEIHTISGDWDGTHPGDYGEEGYVYQEWHPLPVMDGNHAVIGSWVVDGQAAGLMVRETDQPVTDYYARFVPHAIPTEVRPDQEQVQAWLNERAI